MQRSLFRKVLKSRTINLQYERTFWIPHFFEYKHVSIYFIFSWISCKINLQLCVSMCINVTPQGLNGLSLVTEWRPVYLHLSLPSWLFYRTIPRVQRFNCIIKLMMCFSVDPKKRWTLDWVLSSLYMVTRRSSVEVTHRLLATHPCNLFNYLLDTLSLSSLRTVDSH